MLKNISKLFVLLTVIQGTSVNSTQLNKINDTQTIISNKSNNKYYNSDINYDCDNVKVIVNSNDSSFNHSNGSFLEQKSEINNEEEQNNKGNESNVESNNTDQIKLNSKGMNGMQKFLQEVKPELLQQKGNEGNFKNSKQERNEDSIEYVNENNVESEEDEYNKEPSNEESVYAKLFEKGYTMDSSEYKEFRSKEGYSVADSDSEYEEEGYSFADNEDEDEGYSSKNNGNEDDKLLQKKRHRRKH